MQNIYLSVLLHEEDLTKFWSELNCVATTSLGQSVTNIFEISNILVTNIYSDIRLYQIISYKYIQIFVRVKIHTNVTLCFGAPKSNHIKQQKNGSNSPSRHCKEQKWSHPWNYLGIKNILQIYSEAIFEPLNAA